ncbi:MAG TPA: HAMP domain-containing protein, partial [Spirochaetes bacterium]|nr:HAMP domain-containing protein [Spirochaetota bacterium]
MKKLLLISCLMITTSFCTESFRPHQILRACVDPIGSYYFITRSKSGKYAVSKYDQNFHRLWQYDQNGRGQGDLYYAVSITADGEGNVYIKNDVIGQYGGYEEEQILKLKPNGTFDRYILKYRYTEAEQKNMLLHYAFLGLYIRDDRLYFISSTKGYALWSIPLSERKVITQDHHPKTLKQCYMMGKKNIFGNITSDSKYIYFPDVTADKVIRLDIQDNTWLTFPHSNNKEYELSDPFYLAMSKNGSLIVGDMGNRRLVFYDSQLNPVLKVNLKKNDRDFLMNGLFINPKQEIVVLDLMDPALHFYNLKGDYIKKISIFHKMNYTRPLLFILLILVIFLLFRYKDSILQIFKKIPFSFFHKQIVLFVPTVVLASLLTGYLVYVNMSEIYEKEVKDELMSLASSIAKSLPIRQFNDLDKNNRILSPEYERVYQEVSRLLYSKNMDIKDKFEFRWHKIMNDKIYFGVDRYRGGLFSPFFVREKRYLNAIKTKKADIFVYEHLFVHREFLVALIPIQTEDGHFSLFALQQDAVIFDELREKIIYQIVKIAAVIIMISIIVLFILSRVTVKPLRNLVNHLSGVTKGIFNPINIKRRKDEIADVAKAYNYMAGELEKRQKELSRLEKDIHNSIKNKLDSARNFIDTYIHSNDQERQNNIDRLMHVSNLLFHCSKEGKNMMFIIRNSEC